jgi:DNA polymerase I-like protein with 3'-5' exonuclease and polymerase domains
MNMIYYNNPFGELMKFYLQLHDEIVLEFREDLKDDVKTFITDCMLKAEQPFLGEIPAAVDGQIFKYWSKG